MTFDSIDENMKRGVINCKPRIIHFIEPKPWTIQLFYQALLPLAFRHKISYIRGNSDEYAKKTQPITQIIMENA